MHGREGEEEDGKRRRHMWPVHARGNTPHEHKSAPHAAAAAVAANGSANSNPADHFLKDGRKICVGDCALFQSGNSPPFIGIIRWFTKGDYLKLGVNWLYRPSDIKLAKGASFEAAPNEIFYSFHRDEISAESLLHPCKVAFLRKGVELPQGISSFVCRRVYDIANKCLWWLTDQDYIKERQEEVDRLLDKTQLEMHAALQSGGRSPKPLNGPNSPQHLKSASESIQNSGSTTTQVKGKKREKVEQSLDSAKRDRTSKMDDGDSNNLSMIKSELARITEKGGLTDGEGVEKLLQLMQHDKAERKLDSVAKVLLADVIANTDRYDCLQRFVQLKGVLVFDDWLQEAHKSKSGDSSSPKESDKSLDELLLALLRALQKLPVNLHALQTSNIGKSVNNLRSQKNHDIQKKARNLVDTWKKRVDAEMSKLNDSKSVASGQAMSWSVKQTLPDNSHGILKRSGSSDGAIKSSLSQSSSFKSLPAKPANGDPFVKSAPAFSGLSKAISPVNISVANSKETHPKATSAIGASEVQLPSVKEDGSSGSNNSQNNCQSHSGEHARNPSASWKDESKCSASSLNFSKTSGVSSRHRKSSNGFAGAVTAGVHKEASLVKASLGRNTLSDKVSQSGLTSERVPEGSGDSGNNQRLIVRLPNPGRNQVQSGAGSSFDEPSVAGSRASSPVIQDKHEQNEHIERLKGDSHEGDSVGDATTDSPHNQNDNRGSTKPEEGKILFPGEEENRRDGGNCKEQDAIKGAHSLLSNEKGPLSNEIQLGNARKPTNSMNALIESCVKQSESSCIKQSEAGNTPGDDVGMNLLASVAAGEMLKPDSASPAASPVKGSALSDHAAPETKSRLSCENGATQGSNKNEDGSEKPSSTATLVRDELLQSGTVAVGSASVDVKSACIGRENVLDGEQQEKSVKLEGKTDEAILCHGKHAPTSYEKVEASEVEKSNQFRGKRKASGGPNDNLVNGKRAKSPPKESKPADITSSKLADGNTLRSEISCIHSGDGDGSLDGKVQEKGEMKEQTAPLASDVHIEKPDAMNDDSLVKVESSVDVGSHQACNNTSTATPVTGSTAAVEEINATDSEKYIDASSVQLETSESLLRVGQTDFHSPSVSGVEPTKGDHSSAASMSCQEPTQTALTQETEHGAKCEGQESPKTSGQAGGALDDTSLSKASGQDTGVKCIFDLNEGISNDEANPEDHSMQAAFSSQVAHPGVLPFMVPPPIPTASVPITVAAPAKRPFVPPENLLKSKGEVGWKGSAATSAFRPAEPRKVLEMPLSVSETSSDTLTMKQSRPQFDFDLNVADERVLQDIVPQTSGQGVGGSVSNTHTRGKSVEGLDLDLNRVDEGTDFGLVSASTSRSEVLSLEVRPPPGIRSNGEATASRGIDLNDGPGLDDAAAEPVSKNQQAKSGAAASLMPPIGGPRLNNAELGNLSSWFPPGNSYSTVTIPQFLPSDRGDHSYPFVAAVGAQRYLGTGAGGVPLGSDSYRAPVLPSPAMSFNPYPTFPFASSFPIASTSFSAGATTYVDSSTGGGPVFPPVASQLAGPANPISSAYLRPVLISLPDSSTSSSVSTSSQRWGRQGLDLNAGPGIADTAEGRDEKLLSMRQQFVAGSQLSVEDQARLFQVVTSGGGLKRKDPEGGWEMFPYNKQQSRQ